MASTPSRPPGALPNMHHHAQSLDNNLSHEHIFVERVTNILEARRRIYRQALLRELRRLRRLVLASNPDPTLTPPSPQPSTPDPLPHPNSSRSHTSKLQFARQTLHTTSHTHPPARQSRQQAAHPSSLLPDNTKPLHSHAFSDTVREPSTSHPHHHKNDINISSRQVPQLDPHSQSPTDVALRPLKKRQSLIRASAIPEPDDSNLSSPLQPTMKSTPVLEHVLLSHRRLCEMREAYASTPSPCFFVTYSGGPFSFTPQPDQRDPLQTNTKLNLTAPNTMRGASSNQFSSFETPRNSIVQNEKSLRPYRRRYVPPLLAKLFYEQEILHLFDSDFRYSFSPQKASLNKALDLYIRQLFLAQPTTGPVLQPRLNRFLPCSSDAKLANRPISEQTRAGKEPLASYPALSPLNNLEEPKHGPTKFQLRTFHHTLIPSLRHRVPVAQWRDDTEQAKLVSRVAQPLKSHNAYAVPLNDRGLPRYTSTDDSNTGAALGSPRRTTFDESNTGASCGSGSTMRAFGFQSRTNYPFRRTYCQPRTEKTCLVPPNTQPRVSYEFASRVPVSGLSTTLLHLFQPNVTRGLFFGRAHPEVSEGLESDEAKGSYSISGDGRLVPDSIGK